VHIDDARFDGPFRVAETEDSPATEAMLKEARRSLDAIAR
jgi:hypothetical protein